MKKRTPATPRKKKAKYRGVSVHASLGTWRIRWRVDGRMMSKSFATRSEAEAEAQALVDRRKEEGYAGLRGVDARTWRDLATLSTALGGATLSQLLAVWERHKGEVLGGEVGLTLADAVTRFVKLIEREGVDGDNLARYKKHLGRLSVSLGDRPVLSISADDLRDWFAELKTPRGGKVEGWTLIHHHKTVGAFFTRVTVEGWRADNPMGKVRPPEKPVEDVEFLTVEDGRRLFAANSGHPISLRLALEAFGGLRYTGSGRLEVSEVDFASRAIVIPASKSKDGKRHFLQGMPDNLWHWLEKWRHTPEAWDLTPRQHLAAKSAAFARAKVTNSGNALRHSFCTYHIATRKDAALTAILMQHTNPTMLYRHYRGAAPEADGAAWFAILP